MNTTKRYLASSDIEGLRCLDKAMNILSTKTKLDGDVYTSKKYVRMAGLTAYAGVLQALKSTGLVKPKKRQRLDVKDYQEALATSNEKMLNHFKKKSFHV